MPEYNLPNYHMGNLILVLSAIAWASAQVLKVVVVLITRRRLDWRYIWASGGMPSSHSAFVCACASTTGMLYGWSSPLFAIAAVVAIVSEETGSISVAENGMLKRHLAPETLERLLRNELLPQQETPKAAGKLSSLFKSKKGDKHDGEEIHGK